MLDETRWKIGNIINWFYINTVVYDDLIVAEDMAKISQYMSWDYRKLQKNLKKQTDPIADRKDPLHDMHIPEWGSNSN